MFTETEGTKSKMVGNVSVLSLPLLYFVLPLLPLHTITQPQPLISSCFCWNKAVSAALHAHPRHSSCNSLTAGSPPPLLLLQCLKPAICHQ